VKRDLSVPFSVFTPGGEYGHSFSQSNLRVDSRSEFTSGSDVRFLVFHSQNRSETVRLKGIEISGG